MNEFAPEYSKKERLAILLKHMAWAIPLIVIMNFMFFPWFKVYAENAHCYKYGNISGTEVIFFGLFVGLPLLSAILVALLEGMNCIKILQYGQSPLPGEKVFRPTKYVYGVRAKLKPFLVFIIVAIFIGLSVKGVYSAKQTINSVNVKALPVCKSS